jgi:ABC-type lipoprotein export system ATPase subunit
MDLMQELNRDHGLTIVLVTHDPGVGRRCHRIVQMRDGEVVGEDFPNRDATHATATSEGEFAIVS